jgi:hypothetical protein
MTKIVPLEDIPELKENMRRLLEKYRMTLGYYCPRENKFFVKGADGRVHKGNSYWELEWNFVYRDNSL